MVVDGTFKRAIPVARNRSPLRAGRQRSRRPRPGRNASGSGKRGFQPRSGSEWRVSPPRGMSRPGGRASGRRHTGPPTMLKSVSHVRDSARSSLRSPTSSGTLSAAGGSGRFRSRRRAIIRRGSVKPATGQYRVDVFREPHVGDRWVCRRDESITLRYDELILHTRDAIAYAIPEVALLFKAKALRDKDEADFQRVLPLMDRSRRSRLSEWSSWVHPGHPWVERISIHRY